MNNKNILIVGYPKSGTTWLSRLTAELLSAPLVGDWGFDHIEQTYQEGMKRESDFRVYKTHYLFDELHEASTLKIHKVIYIIRDPRDVVISGMHFFPFYLPIFYSKPYSYFSFLKKFSSVLVSNNQKKEQMIEAIFYGSPKISQWCSSSWKDHYKTYIAQKVLFIRYEDLINSPLVESKRVLNHVGLRLDDTKIAECIQAQSIATRKAEMVEDDHLKKIVRKGKLGDWKLHFSEEDSRSFKKQLESEFYTF